MLWVPVPRVDVVNEACPVASSVTVASFLWPSLNVIVPDGMPPPGAFALTVAVKVTDWPFTAGFREEVRDVVLLSLLTVWFSAVEVLVLKFPLPL